MARTTIDDLLAALDTIKILQDTVAKHSQAFAKIIDKFDEIEKRLAALEQAGKP